MCYCDVARRLGLTNVAYVSWYRFSLKSGLRKHLFPRRTFVEAGPFFHSCAVVRDYPAAWKADLLHNADRIVQGELRYYARHWQFVGNPPNWFLNPFNSRVWSNHEWHWTSLQDFHPDLGDVKHVWEASRFEWVVTLARAYAVSGNALYVDTLNQWLGDWAKHNPVNSGPNWKCGQEAAIRIFSLLQAAYILNQWQKPSPVLYEFVYRHIERISANIHYAMAQDNNHGTSEAAALFIGGNWLAKIASKKSDNLDSHIRGNDEGEGGNCRSKKYDHFAFQGRKWLENRVEKLVENDGSFSQHSVTYHRVLLDTLAFVEFWRCQLGAEPFSDMFKQRSRAALNWLCAMTDENSGAAPNLGANDGAMLLHSHGCDYRDFRPSIQVASVLFYGRRLFAEGPWDEAVYWLGLDGEANTLENNAFVSFPRSLESSVSNCIVDSRTRDLQVIRGNDYLKSGTEAVNQNKISHVFPGGYVIMVCQGSWGMLRFPMYRFRPAHNDVFHFDLWWQGINICGDDGSYSYHPDVVEDEAYFGSVKSHNTVCFDDDEQMPRLGRFLLGKWIAADQISAIEQQEGGWQRWRGAYRDWRGHSHQRMIMWKENEWIVEDSISGNFDKAEMRFRLMPDQYKLGEDSVSSSWGHIEISGTDFCIDLEKGFESLYYQEKQPVEILVIRPVKGCNRITTRFILGS